MTEKILKVEKEQIDKWQENQWRLQGGSCNVFSFFLFSFTLCSFLHDSLTLLFLAFRLSSLLHAFNLSEFSYSCNVFNYLIYCFVCWFEAVFLYKDMYRLSNLFVYLPKLHIESPFKIRESQTVTPEKKRGRSSIAHEPKLKWVLAIATSNISAQARLSMKKARTEVLIINIHMKIDWWFFFFRGNLVPKADKFVREKWRT